MTHNPLNIYHSLSYVPYKQAFDFMQGYVIDLAEGKTNPCLWFLEHPPVYTAGMSADLKDMLRTDMAPVYQTNRGGQVTYHGPGQQIVYVMISLAAFKRDVRAYVCFLEEWIIQTLASLGLESFRLDGKIGIWVNDQGQHKKIAALGVRVKKWTAYHGVAINNTVDLKSFDNIVPCGIRELGVTSLQALGVNISEKDLQEKLVFHFNKLLNV